MHWRRTLRLVRISFPNSTLNRNWYGGLLSIDQIEFISCNLRTMEPHCFDAPVFIPLFLMAFIEFPSFEISFEKTGVERLLQLTIEFTRFSSISDNLLKPFARQIQSIDFSYFPDTQIDIHIFKSAKFIYLQSVIMICEGGDVTRSLDETTFGNLRKISQLSLTRCGIDRIHPHTFDIIGTKLINLRLITNKLKSLEPKWFYVLFNTYVNRLIRFHFYGNPIECNCKLHEIEMLKRFIEYSFMKLRRNENLSPPMQSCIATFQQINCGEQRISNAKLCFTNRLTNEYTFSKLKLLVLENGVLVVDTNVSLPIRVLVRSHSSAQRMENGSRCGNIEQLQDSMSCLYLSNHTKVVPVGDLLRRSSLTTFYAIFTVPTKRAWPLHIQTVRRTMIFESENLVPIAPAWAWFTVVGSFLAGIFLQFLWNVYRQKQLTRQAREEARFVSRAVWFSFVLY